MRCVAGAASWDPDQCPHRSRPKRELTKHIIERDFILGSDLEGPDSTHSRLRWQQQPPREVQELTKVIAKPRASDWPNSRASYCRSHILQYILPPRTQPPLRRDLLHTRRSEDLPSSTPLDPLFRPTTSRSNAPRIPHEVRRYSMCQFR